MKGGLEMMRKMREKKKTESPFGKINPKDFTPESFKAFNNSCLRGACNHTLLRSSETGKDKSPLPTALPLSIYTITENRIKAIVSENKNYDLSGDALESASNILGQEAWNRHRESRGAVSIEQAIDEVLEKNKHRFTPDKWTTLGGKFDVAGKPIQQGPNDISVGSPCSIEGRTAGGGQIVCRGGVWIKQ